jgi:hypothetical protein
MHIVLLSGTALACGSSHGSAPADAPVDAPVHMLVDCEAQWNPDFTDEQCELPCQTMPTQVGSGSCSAKLGSDPTGLDPSDTIACPTSLAGAVETTGTFEYDGILGCCVNWQEEPLVQFAVCQP